MPGSGHTKAHSSVCPPEVTVMWEGEWTSCDRSWNNLGHLLPALGITFELEHHYNTCEVLTQETYQTLYLCTLLGLGHHWLQGETFLKSHKLVWASQVALEEKNLPAHAGDTRDVCSISGSVRSPGIGSDLCIWQCISLSVPRVLCSVYQGAANA